jgi:hypothetical protein
VREGEPPPQAEARGRGEDDDAFARRRAQVPRLLGQAGDGAPTTRPSCAGSAALQPACQCLLQRRLQLHVEIPLEEARHCNSTGRPVTRAFRA